MTLLHRRILTLTFLLTFFVITPLIVFYASGYRYDWETNKIERVGLLHITAEPNDTTLVLNGQPHHIGNELVLKSLKPQKYDIIISKEGYHSWYKTLEIFSGQSTFVRNLLLFRSADPETKHVFTNQLIDIESVDGLYQLNDTLRFYNPLFDRMESINIADQGIITNASISADLETIYYLQQDKWFLAHFPSQLIVDITRLLPKKTTLLKQSIDQGLIAMTDEGLWSAPNISPFTGLYENEDDEFRKIITQTLPQEFLQTSDGFWIIATEPAKQRSFLYQSTSPGNRPQMISSLTYSPQYTIAEDYSGFLTIHDAKNNDLHLIDTTSMPVDTATLEGVHTWQWSKDHRQLLTASEFELTIHHIENGQRQELLLRLSTPITDTAWHPQEQHVFYVTNNILSVVERDDRDKRNIYPLIENKKDLDILAVDPDGEKVWFSSLQGNAGFAFWELGL